MYYTLHVCICSLAKDAARSFRFGHPGLHYASVGSHSPGGASRKKLRTKILSAGLPIGAAAGAGGGDLKYYKPPTRRTPEITEII